MVVAVVDVARGLLLLKEGTCCWFHSSVVVAVAWVEYSPHAPCAAAVKGGLGSSMDHCQESSCHLVAGTRGGVAEVAAGHDDTWAGHSLGVSWCADLRCPPSVVRSGGTRTAGEGTRCCTGLVGGGALDTARRSPHLTGMDGLVGTA
ncbi:hypothetical protein H257_02014 [Aphanomyces astaci]|uniref:Uncharacterized protein n=1 Tax=Aphanomyces astaci TaxID=112090 RepID=W4H6R7_APHAT|nr:hypothetical protein H257_02014 [Aphanomyces astaci]ETV86999.1 hypothetical protein H257_02014 [Aphanomyces astaci]|eukprot:XP_009823798.1 hypothetical protein H257_02014 [Aphanomyces astaci]